MNPQQLLARLKAAGSALNGAQLVTLGAAFLAAVALTIGSAYWLNTPQYRVLFTDMDPESASAVVAKLKTNKVDYLIDEGGRTIRVPAARVDEIRLDMTSQGLPTSGRVGFEVFTGTAFGLTDFQEQVNFQRALEGELARSISTIRDVAGVRVHIAMPKPSLFAGQDEPAKASVVLKLRDNRPLPASTITAITGLVAGGVESLRPESVVIVDNFGRPLAKSADNSDDVPDGLQLERQQRIEHDLSTQVVSLLEPILGAGRVRASVSAKINHDSQEETEEKFDPEPVVRSHQNVNQTATGTGTGATIGVAGARANLPPDPGKPAPAAAAAPLPPGSNVHTTEMTNYEVSKLTRHTIQPRGQIARLSVAVIIDDEHPAARGATDGAKGAADATGAADAAKTSKPRSAADIQKVHDLVAAAVGLDTDRGDQLTVENIAFEEMPVEDVPVPTMWQNYGPTVIEGGRTVGVVLVGLFALLFVVKPMVSGSLGTLPAVRSATAGALNPAQTPPRTVQELENEIDAQLQSAANENPHVRLPVLTKRVAALAQREPEGTARLLRAWLNEGER